MRAVTPQEVAALKTATSALLLRIGGVEAAGTITRVKKSALADYASPHHAETSVPVDVLADLERVAHAPLVTAQLARLSGHVLVPIGEGGGSDARAIAAVFREAGELATRWAEAIEDGEITEAERQGLLTELDELQRAACAAMARLRGPGVCATAARLVVAR